MSNPHIYTMDEVESVVLPALLDAGARVSLRDLLLIVGSLGCLAPMDPIPCGETKDSNFGEWQELNTRP